MAKKARRTEEAQTPQASGAQVEQDGQIVRANIHREMVSAASFVSLYANDTQIQVSPWDFRFMFGLITVAPSEDSPNVVVTQIGEVRMSPEHAKRVAMVLVQQIRNYEQSVGPIPQPQDKG